MNIKFKYIGICSLLLISLLSACKDSFLDAYPKSQITTATYYQNDDDFTKAINGVYNAFTTYRQRLEYFPWIDMATPAAVKGGPRFGQFHWGNMNLTPTNYHSDQLNWYADWWKGVARANEVLYQIGENGGKISNDALRNRIKGEALYLRAQFYFFLTYIWGDVPLFTAPITEETNNPTRTPHAQVVAQVIKDLQEAQTLLPSVKEYRGTANLGRASKGAAQALLGKVLCFEKRWSEAEVELKKVIESDDYALTPGSTGFIDQFWPQGENGIESIFEIQYKSGEGDALGNAFVTFSATQGTGIDAGGGGFNYIRPTEWLVDKYETKNGYSVTSTWIKKIKNGVVDSFAFASPDPAFDPLKPFENRDPRLMWTVMYEGSPYIDWKFPGHSYKAGTGVNPDESNYATVKYIVNQGSAYQSDMNMVVLRYADVLLLYAEALLEQNKLSEAVTYINMIRQRPSVNMPVVPSNIAADQSLLRNYYREERIRELALEYGHIFFDLRRWGTYGTEMRNYWTAGKHGRKTTSGDPIPAIKFDDNRDYLWPIPQNEININPNLSQNPGY